MAPPRASALRYVAAVAGLAVFGFGAALFALHARAHSSWPAVMPPSLPPSSPPFAVDPRGWEALSEALRQLPRDASREPPSLQESADASELREFLSRYERALESFALALPHGAVAPPERMDAPALEVRLVSLLRLGRVWSLRARLRALEGQPREAAQDLESLLRYGTRLAANSEMHVASAVASAVQGHALAELARLVRAPGALSEEDLRSLAGAVEEALAQPSWLASSIAGDCRRMEREMHRFGALSRAELAAEQSLRGPSSWLASLVPLRWVYDERATVAAHRTDCHAQLRVLAQPPGRRVLPAASPWASESPGFGAQLDNRVGRLLLRLGLPVGESMLRREENARALLQTARVGLALARYRAAHRSLPERLEDLAPALLPEAPAATAEGRPLRYEGGTLTLVLPEEERAASATVWRP